MPFYYIPPLPLGFSARSNYGTYVVLIGFSYFILSNFDPRMKYSYQRWLQALSNQADDTPITSIWKHISCPLKEYSVLRDLVLRLRKKMKQDLKGVLRIPFENSIR
jgi:hypothetical protein